MIRLPAFLPAVLLLLFAATAPRAEQPDPRALKPQIEELDSYYFAAGESLAAQALAGGPEWVRERAGDVASLTKRRRAHSLPGMARYDLTRPPRRHAWWKYPLYPVLGFPRDAIDALFGGVGHVPLLNLPLTGLAYEAVPTQALMRHWGDWHRWPGRANRNGHGWIDSGAGWGFFSNLRCTEFSRVDHGKLVVWRVHNELVDERLAEANAEIDRRNAEVDRRRAAYLAETLAAYRHADYRAVIQRLCAYTQADRRNRQAKAMLAASLAVSLPGIADRDWAKRAVGAQIRTASRDVLVALKEEIKTLRKNRPNSEEIPFYLVWVNAQLRAHGEAVSEARRLAELDPGNTTYLRLAFDAALRSRVAEWIERAAVVLERATGEGSEFSLHARGRQALHAGQPAKALRIYRALAASHPREARYQYLLGMSLIAVGRDTGAYDKSAALAALDAAVRLAPSPGARHLYAKARHAASLLRV